VSRWAEIKLAVYSAFARLLPVWRLSLSLSHHGPPSTCRDQMTRLPSRAGEHDQGGGQALEGCLHGADGDGLGRVLAVRRGAAQVLEHLPVEHGRLGLTGNLEQTR